LGVFGEKWVEGRVLLVSGDGDVDGDVDEIMTLHGIGGSGLERTGAKTLDVWKYFDNMDRIGPGQVCDRIGDYRYPFLATQKQNQFSQPFHQSEPQDLPVFASKGLSSR